MGEPNVVAWLALALFIPLSLGAFFVSRPAVAAVSVSLLGWMLLPERVAFQLPLLPPIDKHLLAPVLVLLGLALRAPSRFVRSPPGRGVELFAVALLVGTIGTTATNGEPLLFGATVLPAMTLHNTLSMAIASLLQVGVPFYAGRLALRSSSDLRMVVTALALGGLVYAPLVALEVRLSPQLHSWLYGFHQHEFQQMIRAGGYRAMVFMSHGLTVAMFLVGCLLAAAALARARLRVAFVHAAVAAAAIGIALALCKSLASILYALAFVPLVLIMRPRSQLRIAVVVLGLACSYPLLRAAHAFPEETLTSWASVISADRSQSLAFRFKNEDALLAKFAQKPLFGWGQWGRGRVFDESGRDASVTDSEWIILFGERGLVGWACYFGLLVGPVVVAARRIRRISDAKDRILLAALSLLVTANVVDLLPNGLLSSCGIFLAGGLLGLCTGMVSESTEVGARVTVEAEAATEPHRA